jgi:hypothetical protein
VFGSIIIIGLIEINEKETIKNNTRTISKDSIILDSQRRKNINLIITKN